MIERRDDLEALTFYQGYTLRPLVEALRIKHAPTRYNFHTRYLQYDLPGAAAQRLQRLYFVADAADIRAKRDEAERWFYQVLGEIRLENDG